jgi:ribosomal protein S18 acetylase RimI-like enzyme
MGAPARGSLLRDAPNFLGNSLRRHYGSCMHDHIVVRRALRADLVGAARLGAALARQHHEADPARFFLPEQAERGYAGWFEREIDRPEAVVLVARRADEVVGYAYGALEDRDWNLLIDRHGVVHDLFVAEPARALGVGGQLLDAMLRELEALGAPRVVLYTLVTNERAQRLFRSRGFRATLLEMARSAV